MRAFAIAAWLVLLLAGPLFADDATPEPGDPPVRTIVAAAIAHAGLAHDPGPGLRRRARWAALAPWITIRAARDLGWKDEPNTPLDVDHGEVLEVRATWRLDRLVFDASETRALGLDASRGRARRELTREVIHLYYRRQRLRADPAADPLELAEVTAVLDELTGGAFERASGAHRSRRRVPASTIE